MRELKMWKTIDGEVFECASEADAHEQKYMAAWMDDMTINPKEALKLLNNDEKDEFYGTMRQMAEMVFDAILRTEHK
jgi:hypothetical protein